MGARIGEETETQSWHHSTACCAPTAAAFGRPFLASATAAANWTMPKTWRVGSQQLLEPTGCANLLWPRPAVVVAARVAAPAAIVVAAPAAIAVAAPAAIAVADGRRECVLALLFLWQPTGPI